MPKLLLDDMTGVFFVFASYCINVFEFYIYGIVIDKHPNNLPQFIFSSIKTFFSALFFSRSFVCITMTPRKYFICLFIYWCSFNEIAFDLSRQTKRKKKLVLNIFMRRMELCRFHFYALKIIGFLFCWIESNFVIKMNLNGMCALWKMNERIDRKNLAKMN